MKYLLTIILTLTTFNVYAVDLVTSGGSINTEDRRTNASASALIGVTTINNVPIVNTNENIDITDAPLVDDPGCCDPTSGEPLEPTHSLE